ncbi:unnamed protein product [Trichogramma brassicae]|uniref:Uncharacterized protein n=1 Tax=Trichogramma brassicae TaxID=86971 RepID=A0A6H5IHY4_9HYME|nr:unnamed protein product [Trichogramma brassicae]
MNERRREGTLMIFVGDFYNARLERKKPCLQREYTKSFGKALAHLASLYEVDTKTGDKFASEYKRQDCCNYTPCISLCARRQGRSERRTNLPTVNATHSSCKCMPRAARECVYSVSRQLIHSVTLLFSGTGTKYIEIDRARQRKKKRIRSLTYDLEYLHGDRTAHKISRADVLPVLHLNDEQSRRCKRRSYICEARIGTLWLLARAPRALSVAFQLPKHS